MRISIFGSGYVGLVQAAVFSEVGHQVTCMDIDPARIERIQGGDLPFYEPGLNELVQAGIAQNTTDDTAEAVEASDYLFICVGIPAAADGSADLQYVMSVAEGIAAHMTTRVVNKSTSPTADKVTWKYAFQPAAAVMQTRPDHCRCAMRTRANRSKMMFMDPRSASSQCQPKTRTPP